MALFKYFKRQKLASEDENITQSEENSTTELEESSINVTDIPAPSPSDSAAAKSVGLENKSKHARAFAQIWKKNREWLFYIEGKGMFCKWCIKFDKRPFDRDTWNKYPCTRLRLESVRDHEQSAGHKDAVLLESNSVKDQSIMEKYNPPSQQVPPDTMAKVFSCLYFLCKRRIAHTSNFEPMLDLLAYLGLELKKEIRRGQNATYLSEKSIQDMLYCMSEFLEEKILNDMKSSDHFCLMFDETTDCSVIEQMVIRGRYIDDQGKLQVKYLKMIDALKPTELYDDEHLVTLNATKVSNCVTNFIETNGLQYSRLCGLGTDGASVMTGKVNGAIVKIRNVQKEAQATNSDLTKCDALGIHCAAHKLNLSVSQAGDKVPYIKKFKSILRQLYDFYDNSAVRMAGLHTVQKVLKEPELKLTEPSSTRWLSIGASAERLKTILPSVIISLDREAEERGNAIAAGLHRFTTEYQFIATLLLLCDILPNVNRLSRIFQTQKLDYTVIGQQVKSTIKILEKRSSSDGPNLMDITEYIEKLKSMDIQIKYKKQKLSCAMNPELIVEAKSHFDTGIKSMFIDKLTQNIEARFTDSDVLCCFQIFDSSQLPTEDKLDGYGDDSVAHLVSRFGKITKADALNEWDEFRQYMADNMRELQSQEIVVDLCQNDCLKKIYPIMSHFACILRVLPPHTADCERDFSQLGVVKTYLRNRMTQKTLDSVLRIIIEGPAIEDMCFDSCVKIWSDKKQRRY